MEHGNAEPARERANVSRNQNVLYVLPQDSAAIAEFMGPVLEQVASLEPPPESATGPRIVVVTPDAESAVAIAQSVAASTVETDTTGAPRVLAATSARRAARLMAVRQPPVIVGPAGELLDLVRRAALKLDDVRAVVIAWADLLIESGAMPALEALMAEMPKDAPRTVVAGRAAPEVDALVERYARRPRRVGAPPTPGDAVALRYVITSRQARNVALRDLLDAFDPPSAAVYVRSEDAAREVRATLGALGYGDDDIVRVVREAPSSSGLVILYDLPASRADLDTLAASAPNQVIALVRPGQLPSLVALAGAGRLTPFSLDTSPAAARTSDQRTRDALRAILAEGLPARELLTLEPLLGDFDAASLAAAALALLERERRASRAAPPAVAPSQSAAPAATLPNATPAAGERGARRTSVVRVFVNAGERDGVSARDLVGAIANESGIPGARIGRIEIRENHATVELDAADAARAVEALAGATIRGRRVTARIDRDRPPRGGGDGDRVRQRRGPGPRRPGGRDRDRGPSRRRDE